MCVYFADKLYNTTSDNNAIKSCYFVAIWTMLGGQTCQQAIEKITHEKSVSWQVVLLCILGNILRLHKTSLKVRGFRKQDFLCGGGDG